MSDVFLCLRPATVGDFQSQMPGDWWVDDDGDGGDMYCLAIDDDFVNIVVDGSALLVGMVHGDFYQRCHTALDVRDCVQRLLAI